MNKRLIHVFGSFRTIGAWVKRMLKFIKCVPKMQCKWKRDGKQQFVHTQIVSVYLFVFACNWRGFCKIHAHGKRKEKKTQLFDTVPVCHAIKTQPRKLAKRIELHGLYYIQKSTNGWRLSHEQHASNAIYNRKCVRNTLSICFL